MVLMSKENVTLPETKLQILLSRHSKTGFSWKIGYLPKCTVYKCDLFMIGNSLAISLSIWMEWRMDSQASNLKVLRYVCFCLHAFPKALTGSNPVIVNLFLNCFHLTWHLSDVGMFSGTLALSVYVNLTSSYFRPDWSQYVPSCLVLLSTCSVIN